MNAARRKPVMQGAMAFVSSFLPSSGLKPGDKLPTTVVLAEMAGVSYVTMHRALRELTRQGVIARSGRASIFPATGTSSIPKSLEPGTHTFRPWHRTAQRIKDDVRNNVYPPGSALPSMKELQRRYGISYKTLRKSLLDLLRENSLERDLSGEWAVPSFTFPAWRARLVCLVQSSDSYTMAFGQNEEALFRALEVQCGAGRIEMEIYLKFLDPVRGHQRFRRKGTQNIHDAGDLPPMSDPSVLGCVYFIPWQPTQVDTDAIRVLAAYRKPLAVLDETAQLAPPREVAAMPWVRFFTSSASLEPGALVARHLMALGHRRMAFISTDHHYVWSQRRLEGLIAACRTSATGSEVVPFLKDTIPDLHLLGAQRFGIERLIADYQRWRETVPPQFRVEFDQARDDLRLGACRRAETRFMLLPLLAEALADPKITAWVMVNDYIGTIALSFLADKGVRVPDDLSVIAFDDSIEALRSNMSSYNFNTQALAHAMLGLILGHRPAKENAEIRGFITERGTTGPVRR